MEIRYDSSKESAPVVVDTYVPPVVQPPAPPPAPAWPKIAPDLFEIDMSGPDAFLQAKMLDGSGGYDGKGTVIHYGDISGGITYVNGFPNYDEKFSNPSVKPVWGVYPDGTPYLESACDPSAPLLAGVTHNRLINATARAIGTHPELWMRWGMYVDNECAANANNLGIKFSGFGGTVPGATMGVIAEMWFTSHGIDLGTYRYDAEVTQAQELSGCAMRFGSRDIYELHIKANSPATHDGVFEIKRNNNLIWSRKDYYFFVNPVGFTAATLQFYDGGTTKPSGPLMARFDSWAVSTKGWIGPPKRMP